MNTVSSSTGYSASAGSSRGLSGLMSGMDTESMVEKMLQTTQSKIDKQNQLKTQTEWKQNIYRDIISNVNKFQLKYFSFSSDTNLMSRTFFNTMSAFSSSSAVKVSGTSSANAGKTTIEVKQLATSSTSKSLGTVSGTLSSTVDVSQMTDKKVTLIIDVPQKADNDNTEKVALTVELSAAKTSEEIATAIQVAYDAAAADTNYSALDFSLVSFKAKTNENHGNLIIESSAKFEVDGDKNKTSAMGLAMLGMSRTTKSEGGIVTKLNAEPKATLNITLDGITKEVEIINSTSADDVINQLQLGIQKAFGTEAITVNKGTDGSFSLTTGGGRQITVSGNNLALDTLGMFSGQSNKINTSLALGQLNFSTALTPNAAGEYKFTINDKQFTATNDTKLGDLMNQINLSDAGVKISYSALEDKFTMVSTNSGAGFNIDYHDGVKDEFGNIQEDGNILTTLFKGAMAQEGKNAIVVINDVATERSSNSFTVNGLNIELTAETTEVVTIETIRDTEKVFEGIKTFVEDYNKLIDEANGLIKEDSDYKKYPPLTEAQKKDMSENEIKLWEEKAKKGLVRNDSDIISLLQSMRSSLYLKPEGAKYTLFEVGIETSGDWRDNGKLIIDETKLKQMLEQNSEEVANLFNNTTDGIAKKLDETIKMATNTSSGSPGSLVRLAGVAGRTSDKQNYLTKRIEEIEDRIDSLKRTYEKEKTRYWAQFNAMESAIANLNTQSAWLAQYTM